MLGEVTSILHLHQTLCVYWQGFRSGKLSVGNGTRQGGVLFPYLFTRFVRPLLSAISQSKLGCSIGSLFVNSFAYADDKVLRTEHHHGVQCMHLLSCLNYGAPIAILKRLFAWFSTKE